MIKLVITAAHALLYPVPQHLLKQHIWRALDSTLFPLSGGPPMAISGQGARLTSTGSASPRSLFALNWEDKRVPPSLKNRYSTHTLPSPEDIQAQMELAWGFVYYQPVQLLLIRFDREWNERYIQNTPRHATFKR